MSWTFLSLSLRWMLGWWLGGRMPTLPAGSPRRRAPVPAVSVIVPARNEAASLPALLRSLSRQSLTPASVTVVDDQSSDATAEIARNSGVAVVQPGPPPPGWLGKPWSCAHGAACASGDVLVFVDADTTLAPETLERLAPLALESGGLVSIAPYHETRWGYEWASALMNLVALMGTGASSVAPGAPITGAFGPCVCLSRKTYERIGGHSAVRDEVLDDMALARRCREAEVPVRCLTGGSLVRYRMYPAGLAQLVEGWSKNFASGAGETPPWRLLAIAAWMSGLIEAGWWSIFGGLAAAHGAGPFPLVHAVFAVAFALQLWMMLRVIGNFSAAALVHPLLTLAFLLLCANSARFWIRGQATWKGRTVVVRAR